MSNENVYQGSIAIVGGGISGVVLGIALLKRGLKIQIYEQARLFSEIGAGVGFNDAARRAMKVCSSDIHDAFEKVSTRNQFPDKQDVFFDFLDGTSDKEVGKEEHLFTLTSSSGANAVHRAHYLEELVKLVPDGITHFRKHLDTIEERPDGQFNLLFHDGSSAVHDAVIGTDGIKSAVRVWLVGKESPSAHPVYTHKYAYRGLIPGERAVEALGPDLALNAKLHMGQDAHVLTFPVNHGKTTNVVAFRTDPNEWPDYNHLVRHAKREEVYHDFSHFGATVQHIIALLEPNLDCWAIFDTGDAPLKAYNKGKVVVVGDAGHATTPHHGAGAGMCIEDCAILAELLADPRVAEHGHKGVEAAFQAYSDQRLERTQWLVQSSRRTGDLYEFRTEKKRADMKAIEEELGQRWREIWNGQVSEFILQAKELLGEALAKAQQVV